MIHNNDKQIMRYNHYNAAHLPVKQDIKMKFPISYFGQACLK